MPEIPASLDGEMVPLKSAGDAVEMKLTAEQAKTIGPRFALAEGQFRSAFARRLRLSPKFLKDSSPNPVFIIDNPKLNLTNP